MKTEYSEIRKDPFFKMKTMVTKSESKQRLPQINYENCINHDFLFHAFCALTFWDLADPRGTDTPRAS